jgi:hypothetical protein
VTVPVRRPVAVGEKVTISWQFAAAGIADPQLVVCEKSPVVTILVILTVPELLAFASNSGAGWLEVPT